MLLDTHPRTLRSNIWRGLLSATDQEIHDGMNFYHGAYGLCKLISLMFNVTVNQVAGVYAALSPLNTWGTNVSNIMTVLKWIQRNKELDCKCKDPFPELIDDFIICSKCTGLHSISVNTPIVNRNKALSIANGKEPLTILRGDKVRSFYLGISDPTNLLPIPVDRHLINLALGTKVTDNQELGSIVSNKRLLAKIKSIYSLLGEREKLGNRLAAIAWFVQRRIQSGQIPILQPSRIVCCNKPMHSHGNKPRRFCCSKCGKSVSQRQLDYHLPPKFKSVPISYIDDYPIFVCKDNRKRIHLGVGHEFANKSGWQYLNRYLVAKELKRKLLSEEHVHHKNLVKSDDRLDNYQLMLAESHGKYHVHIAELAGYRGSDGRFIEHENPITI